MGLPTEQLGVILIGKDDVFTPPFAIKQRVRFNWFSTDDDPASMFAAREAHQSDDLRLQTELAAWDAASDEALAGLEI